MCDLFFAPMSVEDFIVPVQVRSLPACLQRVARGVPKRSGKGHTKSTVAIVFFVVAGWLPGFGLRQVDFFPAALALFLLHLR
jgi:hypothetical protein